MSSLPAMVGQVLQVVLILGRWERIMRNNATGGVDYGAWGVL